MFKHLAADFVTLAFLGGAVVTIASVLKSAAKSADKVPHPVYSISALAHPPQRGGIWPAPGTLAIENVQPPNSSKAEEVDVRRGPGRSPDETDEEYRSRRRERRARRQTAARAE